MITAESTDAFCGPGPCAPTIDVLPGFEIFRQMVDPAPDQPDERWIWVTFRKEGIHRYPAALEDPKLKDVEFLGYPHRHIFHFKVGITVFHDDRDIEFIMFKRELENLYADKSLELNFKSCEMIAVDLHKYIATAYPGRGYDIEVSEDGENGCRLVWNRKLA